MKTIYGNNQGKLKKPLTSMKIGEVIKTGPSWTRRYGSSAAGRYQFMRATLLWLLKEVPDLTGFAVVDEDMQNPIGYHLLKQRGAGISGRLHRLYR